MRCLRFFFLPLLILCITTVALAQSTNATVSGLVLDPSGKVIPNADIEILNEGTGVHYSGKTNDSGIYTVSILPPGEYRVQVSRIGFKAIIKPGIILNVQSAVALNFTLPIGAASETVTVDSGTSLINTTDASVSAVVDRAFVENIPLNGRSFQDLISMTPGVVTASPQSLSQLAGYRGDFSVNGQRTESNYYTVDGVSSNTSAGYATGNAQSATGGTISAGTALGTTQSLMSVDAMQEFRVSSSTYSSEFGRAPGGQFSLATRSGTNDFHGTAYDYLRNNIFDANDWFNKYYGRPQTALRQNDFGGTFGGPMRIPELFDLRNKSFFFASYEGLRLTQPQAATIQYVPSLSLRQTAPASLQPILNSFPNPTGAELQTSAGTASGLSPFVLSYSLPSKIDSTSVRLDHTLSPKLALFFRAGYTPSSASTRTLSALGVNSANIQSYTLGATSSLAHNLTNEFRLGYSRSNSSAIYSIDPFGGALPVNLASQMGLGGYDASFPEISVFVSGIGTSTLFTKNAENLGRQWNATDSVSFTRDKHQIKIGIDYRRIISPLQPSSPFVYAYYSGRQSVLNNATSSGSIQTTLSATPIFNQYSAYAQDEWRTTSRLSLSLGIRWDMNPPPHEENGNDAYTLSGSLANPSSLALAPRGTPLWQTAHYNFAPRLGLAWTAITSPGWETVIRTGGGIFFDTNNEIATQGFNNIGFRAASTLTGTALPVTPAQVALPVTATLPCATCTVNAFPDHLQLPYTLEWNVSLEQAIAKDQNLTISYLGSNGRRLPQQQLFSLAALNPHFGLVYYYPGQVTSNYQALQTKFQRSVGHGLSALVSYTWSHSLDFGSNDSALPYTRGNSDFDVRHNLQLGATWTLPNPTSMSFAMPLLRNWGVDFRMMLRTGFPVTLGGSTVLNAATGSYYTTNVDIIPGRPFYLYGSQYPGGRAINGGPNAASPAFVAPTGKDTGDAPRNFIRGFGENQLNLALRREFPIVEALKLQFRAETFNLLNHPNFGLVDPTLTDATFGQATSMLNQSLGTVSSLYQQGGSRSFQFALKLTF